MRFTDSPHAAFGDLKKGSAPPNVFAADPSSVWQAKDGREHWIAFDLKVRRRVAQFVYTAGGDRSSRNPRECSLEYAESLSGPWALAKRFRGVRDKAQIVVDNLLSKGGGAGFIDARYFRLVIHSTFGGTAGRNHGATIASVRFIGDSPQRTPMSYQRDVAITAMAQLGELTFTQGFAGLMVDGLRHVVVAIRYRGDTFEEIHDGLRIGEIIRGIMDIRARASSARSMPFVWCVLRVVRDGALRDGALRDPKVSASKLPLHIACESFSSFALTCSLHNVTCFGPKTVAVSSRRGARALPSASWIETSSVEVQTLCVQIECGRAQIVLVDDYGGVDLPLVRLRVDESRQDEPAMQLRMARLAHKWTRRDEAPGAAGNPEVSATAGSGTFGVQDISATVNMRIAMDYFEHAAVDDVAATRSSSSSSSSSGGGGSGGAGAPSAPGSPFSSAISFVDNASSSGSWCECMGVCPLSIAWDAATQSCTLIASEGECSTQLALCTVAFHANPPHNVTYFPLHII